MAGIDGLPLLAHHEAVTIALMEQTAVAHRDYPNDIPVRCFVLHETVMWRPSGLLKAYRVTNVRFLPEASRRCPFVQHVLILSIGSFHVLSRPNLLLVMT